MKDRKIEITVETHEVLVIKQRDLPGDSQTQLKLDLEQLLVGIEEIQPGKDFEIRKGNFVKPTNRWLGCLNSLRGPKGSKGI